MTSILKRSIFASFAGFAVACAPAAEPEPMMEPEPAVVDTAVAAAPAEPDPAAAPAPGADIAPAPVTGPQTLNLTPMGTQGIGGEVMLRSAAADPAAAPGTPAAMGQTEVTVQVTGAQGPAALPVFMYRGSCSQPGEIMGAVMVVPVSETEGTETATIPVPLDAVLNTQLSIQVHPTGNEPTQMIACVDTMAGGTEPTVPTTTEPTVPGTEQ